MGVEGDFIEPYCGVCCLLQISMKNLLNNGGLSVETYIFKNDIDAIVALLAC